MLRRPLDNLLATLNNKAVVEEVGGPEVVIVVTMGVAGEGLDFFQVFRFGRIAGDILDQTWHCQQLETTLGIWNVGCHCWYFE